MSIENQLREALSARADEVGAPGVDPYARVSSAIALSRRRRRTAAIAGVATLVALAAAIPSLGELGRNTTTPAKKTTVVVPGPNDPRWASIATWPTRGSLAGDSAFLTSARALLGAQLIFAGDVGGTDRLVVRWQRDDSGADQLTDYTGAVGASPAEMRSTMTGSPEGLDTVLLRQDDTPDGWLLLLARPTLRVAEVSPTARIQLDGT